MDCGPEIRSLWTDIVFEVGKLAFTVLVVDRIVDYREHRRWAAVKGHFWTMIRDQCYELNDAYSAWLGALEHCSHQIAPEQINVLANEIAKQPETGNTETPPSFSHMNFFMSGFSCFADSTDWLEARVAVDAFILSNGSFIKSYEARNCQEAWINLRDRSEAPIERLEKLAIDHSAFAPPELFESVLQLRRDLDHLILGVDFGAQLYQAYERSLWNEHLDESMKTAMLAVLKLNTVTRQAQQEETHGYWWRMFSIGSH